MKNNEENKVAVITEYYNSSNYGGNLQAYALTKFLNDNFIYAEQLRYKRPHTSFKQQIKTIRGFRGKASVFLKRIVLKTLQSSEQEVRTWKQTLCVLIKKIIQKTIRRKDFERVKKREMLTIEFGVKQTPHNDIIFNDEDLKGTMMDKHSKLAKELQKYSAFITGSDQVWHSIKKQAYFLFFVPKDKKKISYAASIAKPVLRRDEQDFFKVALKDFDAISVREKSDVKLLRNLCDQNIEWVLDPTLLIDSSEWEKICSPPLRNEPYLFCYFLGNEKEPRKVANEYALKHGLKILSIPYLTEDYPFEDFRKHNKQEERLFEVSVEEFLSLIRYAEVIFTDSFHAVVFSFIFKKQYFVFDRKSGENMNSRIISLLDIFEEEDRFCYALEKKECLNYIENLSPINYEKPFPKLKKMKGKSRQWLLNNINT